MRVLLFTGKGGVGKTTTAAASALRCADAGLRTIVLSTDPAHSLADAYDVALGDHPVEVAPNLWGQQLDTQARMEDTWVEIQAWLMQVFEWAGVAAIEAEELAVIPGLDEIFSLSDIKGYADSGEWDVVVVDCAPTAETLRLLSLPEILRWYMDRVFPMSRKLNKVVSPILGRVAGLPTPGDDVFGSASKFYDRLDGVRELLCDTERTSVRLVVNPERLVVAEARRTHTYLSLFGYRVDAVVANRLLPEAISDPWFEPWKARHAEHLTAIEEGFAPLPILRAELAADELVGIEALRAFGAGLYGDLDPSEVLHPGEPLQVVKKGSGYELVLELPFADKDDLELGRRDDELLIRVGSHRRALLLPDSLRRRPVGAASLRDGRLHVTFAGDADRDRTRSSAGGRVARRAGAGR
ncbi:ArsA family ATPase [Aquihabitans sp. G128]|uniref:ArsA family ATPase n=1 Tax=Aquihabitans sp. G128 TaxID=2849779 RepID=UPI001C23263A|nr:ArsA family ATPase [Aquihabitans sp. G128]QXC62307.1 ArsA family ATPase [Aquihabitans sp. G128]